MKVFQYVLIRNFPVAKDAEPKKSELLGDVRTVLAKDQDSALKQAVRAIPADVDPEDVDIAIRPF